MHYIAYWKVRGSVADLGGCAFTTPKTSIDRAHHHLGSRFLDDY